MQVPSIENPIKTIHNYLGNPKIANGPISHTAIPLISLNPLIIGILFTLLGVNLSKTIPKIYVIEGIINARLVVN